MEFNSICNNLLALCGFELSYNLSILIALKSIVKQYIESINESIDYEDIIVKLMALSNIYKRDTFAVNSFNSPFINNIDDDQIVFRFDSETKPAKDDFFTNIIEHARQNNERKNISGLNLNKQLYMRQLTALAEHTEFRPMEPDNINELLNNIGNKIAYKGWFMKSWSLLYDELLVDMMDKEVTNMPHPLDALYEKLKIIVHKNKYIGQLLVYFEQVISETKTSMVSVLKSDFIEVNLSKNLLKYMAEMMLNLYTQLAHALYNHQRYNTFNKSARVHYALMYYLVMTCKPKLYEYDITQQSVLRYILLPKKAIDESLDVLKNKKSLTIVAENESSDEEVEKEPIKRRRRAKSVMPSEATIKRGRKK